MPKLGESARAATIAFSTKGRLLAIFIEILKEQNRWDAVFAELGEESRAIILSNPLASDWIIGKPLTEIHCITYELYGSAAIREYSYLGGKRVTLRFMMPFVEATMRLFGMSAPTLLNRMDQLTAHATKGMEIHFVRDTDTSGTIHIRCPGSRALPHSVLESTIGALMSLFDFTRTLGTFGEPSWNDKMQNAGKFTVTWRSR